MADNVTLPFTGTGDATPVIATDDVSGVHYQRVKLVDGTLNGTGAIGGDATNGLDVDVTRLPALVAGSAVIGKVSTDQTTPGTTDLVTVATGQGAGAAIGATSGAAVITDANGTIQQYLRGLIKLAITAGSFLVTLSASTNLIGYIGRKLTYGGKRTALTTASFSGLTTTNAWQSDAVSTSGALDVHLHLQTKGAAGSTGYVDFYVAEILSDGTVYVDGVTGTEASYAVAGRKNARYLGSLLCNGTTAVQGAMKLSDIYAVIPSKFVLIGVNNSGGTISATGGDTIFQHEFVN